MEEKKLGDLLAEIEDLKEKLASEKTRAERNFRFYTNESAKFRRYRTAVRSVVNYIDDAD